MNRKFILWITFVCFTLLFTSCESLTSCKICRQVTYIDGVVSNEGPESEYCDADLVAVETAKDVIYGNTRKTWECR